jgi:hypothetical protein
MLYGKKKIGDVLGHENSNLARLMYIFSEVLETELVDQDTSLLIQDIVRKAQAGAPAHLVCVLRVRVRVRCSPCLSVSLY